MATRAASVVLTTYNDDHRLELCLEGYAAQSSKDFELLVVNDGSLRPGGVDSTQALVEGFRPNLDVRYLYLEPESEQFRLAAARNLGMRQASGKTLIISDGDCVPHPDLVQLLIQHARDDRVLIGIRKRIPMDTVAGLTAADLPNLPNLVWQDDERLTVLGDIVGQIFLNLKDSAPPGSWEYCWGFLFAAPLWKFKMLGGFDERFVCWGGEDHDMGERLVRSAGCRFYSLPEAVVYHLDHPAWCDNPERSAALLDEIHKDFTPVRNGGPMWPERNGIELTGASKGDRKKISLCLIAKNEEANIWSCLFSVADLVDEIIVVDTGSSDRTKEMAAAVGARVFDFAWVDSFAAARNESLRPATGDWILWLDADERFDHDNREKLRPLLAGLKDENVAYVMKQRSAPEHTGGSDTVVDQVRLFRNQPSIRWRYRVHEQILPALRQAEHDVRFTDIALDHTGYQDTALRQQKTQRNLRLLHLEEREQPEDPFTLFNLGWAYQELGQAAKALPLLRRSLSLSHPSDSIVRKLYVLLTQAHRQLGQEREALAACRAGRARCPDDAELLFLEGQMLREHGDLGGAETCWRELLQTKPGAHFASLDAGLRGHKTRYHLGELYRDQGRTAEAESEWRAIVATQRRFGPAWQRLGELYLAQKQWPELEEALGALKEDPSMAAEAMILQARVHLARQAFGPARQLLEEAIAQNPRALAPRVFLSHVLLQSGDLAAAELALRAVLELDPRQVETWRNLAVLLNSQHRFEQAAEACQHGLFHCPGEANLLRLQRMVLHPQAALNHTNGNPFHHAPNDRLRLAFASFSPFAFTTDTPYQEPLGGSESALCYLAEALAQQGHQVFLVNANKERAICRGVGCLPLSEASIRQIGPLDAFIVQNFAGKGRELRTLLSADTPLVFWSQHAHDQPGVQALRDPAECQAYDFIVMVSDWQRQQFMQHFGLDPERTVVLRNAISPAFLALFADNTPVLAQKAKPPVLAYTSTPFRGLDVLLDAFPLIRRAVPLVVLKVFSSMQVYHIPEAEEEARYGELYRKCRQTEGVEYIGSLPQPELAGQLRAASVLAYPNTFAETSCIAVLEAMASGCRVVTSDLGALPETCSGFARLISLNGDRAIYMNHFVEETARVLQELTAPDSAGAESLLRSQVEYIDRTATWPVRAREWVASLKPKANGARVLAVAELVKQ